MLLIVCGTAPFPFESGIVGRNGKTLSSLTALSAIVSLCPSLPDVVTGGRFLIVSLLSRYSLR